MKPHTISPTKKPNFKIDEIALVFLVAAIALAISFWDKNDGISDVEAEKITGMIMDEHDLSFAASGVIDENKLNEIKSLDYAELKKSFKVRKDFCVYIEDGNGNTILTKGSSKLNGEGLVCRE